MRHGIRKQIRPASKAPRPANAAPASQWINPPDGRASWKADQRPNPRAVCTTSPPAAFRTSANSPAVPNSRERNMRGTGGGAFGAPEFSVAELKGRLRLPAICGVKEIPIFMGKNAHNVFAFYDYSW